MSAKFGFKALFSFILILLLGPFQLSLLALAVEPLPPTEPVYAPVKAPEAAGTPSVQPQAATKNPVSNDTKAEDPTRDEVLNNILGTPPAAATSPEPQAQPAKPQKQFSFLDPEAQDVLAPNFDYGAYSFNMRVLDGYKKKVMDAMETSRQLSLNLSEDKVMALLKESDAHKRQFETLYLGHKTQAGLDEYGLARKTILQALALTTASPKV